MLAQGNSQERELMTTPSAEAQRQPTAQSADANIALTAQIRASVTVTRAADQEENK